jgi:hypothetical protein
MSLLQKYIKKTFSYKLLKTSSNFLSKGDKVAVSYFYWFYKKELNHTISGTCYKVKQHLLKNNLFSFILLCEQNNVHYTQLFFLSSPFIYFIKKRSFKQKKKNIFLW